MIKLQPCPFCGNENNRIRKTYRGDNGYYAWCPKCGAKGGVVYVKEWHATKFIAQGQAATKWNQRAGENIEIVYNEKELWEAALHALEYFNDTSLLQKMIKRMKSHDQH